MGDQKDKDVWARQRPAWIWHTMQLAAQEAAKSNKYPKGVIDYHVNQFQRAFALLMEVGTPLGVILEALESAMMLNFFGAPDHEAIRFLVAQSGTLPAREARGKKTLTLDEAIAVVAKRMNIRPAKSERCARLLHPEVRKELGLPADGSGWPTWSTIRNRIIEQY